MKGCPMKKSVKECSSSHTINNHRRNSFRKLGVHSMAEFNRYAAEKGLFKTVV